MNVIGIIPARMAATRFPGKPLAPILGMPMIGHCYHRTRLAEGVARAYVATCDDAIASYINSIGGNIVMTAPYHNRATTRTAEAMALIERESGTRYDVVVMVQGDEPLISPETISATLGHFSDPRIEIVNVMSHIRTQEAFCDRNNVKVVVNNDGDALYFSREPIPSPWKGWEHLSRYMQTGIIAFRRDALLRFNAIPESPLEQFESIDMNRILETGGRVRMVAIDELTIGVDTPDELLEAEKCLAQDIGVHRYLDNHCPPTT